MNDKMQRRIFNYLVIVQVLFSGLAVARKNAGELIKVRC